MRAKLHTQSRSQEIRTIFHREALLTPRRDAFGVDWNGRGPRRGRHPGCCRPGWTIHRSESGLMGMPEWSPRGASLRVHFENTLTRAFMELRPTRLPGCPSYEVNNIQGNRPAPNPPQLTIACVRTLESFGNIHCARGAGSIVTAQHDKRVATGLALPVWGRAILRLI